MFLLQWRKVSSLPILENKLMSDLTIKQMLSMTDKELVDDLVDSGDIVRCTQCGLVLQESKTGCRTITDDQGNKKSYCSDCYFSYKPLQQAVEAFLVSQPKRDPSEEFKLFAGLPF